MTIESTNISNCKLIVDEFNIPVAVRIEGTDKYHLYDTVSVKSDSLGCICPGIYHDGRGTIIKISRFNGDNFFGVLMDNGEFGYTKATRLELVARN